MMRAPAPALSDASSSTLARWGEVAVILLCAVIASAISLWFTDYYLLNHDVAAQWSSSENVFSGARLNDPYGMHETPLAVYLYMLPVWLHTWLPDIPPRIMMAGTILVLLHGMIAFSWRLMVALPGMFSRVGRCGAVAGFYYILAVLPVLNFYPDFGQREHLASIFIVPYILICMATISGVLLPRHVRFIASGLAAIGFCLKPHFVLLFITSEVMVWIKHRTFTHVWRIEFMTVMLLGMGYLATWYLLYRAFFHELEATRGMLEGVNFASEGMLRHLLMLSFLPCALALYGILRGTSTYRFRILYGFALVIAAILIAWLQGRGFGPHLYLIQFTVFILILSASRGRPGEVMLGCFSLTLLSSAVNGWGFAGLDYTALGVMFCLFLLVLLTGKSFTFPFLALSTVSATAVFLLAYGVSFFDGMLLRQKDEYRESVLAAAHQLSDHIQGKQVMTINIHLPPMWPILTEAGARWSGPERNMPYLVRPITEGEAMNAAESAFQQKMIRFISYRQPEWILVFDYDDWASGRQVSVLSYLQRNSSFRALWKQYRRVHRIALKRTSYKNGHFELYRRTVSAAAGGR